MVVKVKKVRDYIAIDAHFRNSAGPIKRKKNRKKIKETLKQIRDSYEIDRDVQDEGWWFHDRL